MTTESAILQPTHATDTEATPEGPKRWHAGTLSYTAGGLSILFFWLLWGDFALSLKERSVPLALQALLKRFEASDFIVGALIGTLPQLISVFFSPVISFRSDRHRGRFGRRIPYLFIPTPIAFASMIGLAYSPALGTWLQQFPLAARFGPNAATLACFAVFWTIFEFCSITCNSVIMGLINDVVPSQWLGRFFGLFRIFSLAAGMAFSWWLLGKVETHYVPIFIGIGALYGVGFSTMCLRVREGEYPPPSPVPPRRHGGIIPPAIRTYARECFTNPYYRWYFASIALAAMGFQAINLFYLYFAQSVGMNLATLGKYFTAQMFCSILVSLPVGWLCDRIHPLRVTALSLVAYAAATLGAFLLIHDALMCGIAQVICGCIAGCWGTATAALAPALLPKMKFTTFASAAGLVSAFGLMVVSPICGRMLDVLHHEYRYIFLWACGFTILSLLATFVVYRRFMAYGGPRGYVAPE